MNERIRELSAIAKNLTTDDAIHLSRIHNRTLSLDELGEIFEQKFAELLIRECSAYVKNSNCFTYASQADLCAERMTQHFGVEE